MNALKTPNAILHKALSFLKIRVIAGGLEISDQALRLAYYEKNGWRMEALRLAPGILTKGKITDAAAFTAALKELKSKVPAVRGRKKMNVVISLSSVSVYSQVFSLPIMSGGDFDKAIDLNVQMASPMDINHAYFSWQILGRDEVNLRSEIAAAFVDRAVVDEITQALYDAGFITVGVESRALALTRILREAGSGLDAEKSYLLLDIDDKGIDFLIIRGQKLYFEYANQWSDLADEKGEISVEKFQEALEASLRQVMNFYAQHWRDPLEAVILSATVFRDEAERAVEESLALPVLPLALSLDSAVSPEWYVAFGCALRGINMAAAAKEINLSGSHAMDIFHEEQVLGFLALWRILIPAVLAFIIVVLVLADLFLGATRSGIEAQAAFRTNGVAASQVAALTASSTVFNQSVSLIANTESQISKNYLIISVINAAATANGIVVNNISFQGATAPVLVAGTAQSADSISSFKDAIQANPHFGVVTLPVVNIQQDSDGGYSFSMSFPLSSSF